jgi:hypothetical protein
VWQGVYRDFVYPLPWKIAMPLSPRLHTPCAQDAEEEVFEMIGEVDTKGTGEIDLEDFIKMVSAQLGELPGEALS